MTVLDRVHTNLRRQGYALTTGAELGLPRPDEFLAAFEERLEQDPRAAEKKHARDVVQYDGMSLRECDSIAFITDSGQVVDDFSRFRLLDFPGVAGKFLSLVPSELARSSGGMSADYFSYSMGAQVGAHRDGFGDFIIIWVLYRDGSGCENFLVRDSGEPVLSRVLAGDEVLIFRDELFLHGITALAGSRRDVLICITLRNG